MSARPGATYFFEHLRLIAAVTEMLNKLPTADSMYVHVELRSEGDHAVVGQWSDEIASDSWYYEERTS